jgi:serine O-acetyltransferase
VNARLVETVAPRSRWALDDVVDALAAANTDLLPLDRAARGALLLPSREALEVIVSDLQAGLFPAHFGASDVSAGGLRQFVRQRLDTALTSLQEQVRRGLLLQCPHDARRCDTCEQRAGEAIEEFARRLPAVRKLLGSDARAAYEGDPAATSADEAVFCYPGITAITYQRLAHELYALGVPLIPRMITEIAHGATGIDIHPGARIGGSFFIDHGTGVVIGETCVIGERVRLYQGVTLGAKSFPTDERGRPIKGRPRHPIVENDVTIYAGATILGRITIGRGSSIGGNVWLTRAVPPGSSITQGPARDDTFEGGSGI